MFLSVSILSHSGFTFRSLAFCPGLSLIAIRRLLLLVPSVIYFNLKCVHVFVCRLCASLV